MARKKKKSKQKSDAKAPAAEAANASADAPAKDTPKASATKPAATASNEVQTGWPAEDMERFSYLILFAAAVFLVNSLEPGSKGETGLVGFVCLAVGGGLFFTARARQKATK